MNNSTDSNFLGAITVIVLNKNGVISKISKKISDLNINITSISSKTLPENMGKIDLVLSIKNRDELDDLVKKLNMFDFVVDIQRTK